MHSMDILNTITRQFLLFAHLLVFAFAIVTVIREDVALMIAQKVDAAKLKATAHNIALLLILLWFSGFALIIFDSGFDLTVIAAKPKLAAKITIVSLLTANGILLHYLAFPLLSTPQRSLRKTTMICTVLGVVSSVSWIYASFVGVSRLIAPLMNYMGYMGLYILALVFGMIVAMLVVRPHIERLLKGHHTELLLAIENALRNTCGSATYLMLDEETKRAYAYNPSAYAEMLASRIPQNMAEARAKYLRHVVPILHKND